MLMSGLAQVSIAAKLGLLIGMAPLVMGVLYAIRPSERRLALMRPLSLAAVFAALCTLFAGFTGVLQGIGRSAELGVPSLRAIAPGLAEAFIPIFLAFAAQAVAWLCVALGLRRQA
ncbi:MAG TPA: hypothetical protein VLT86_20695 [Vicinamibacterales bacterium]|nr:hypothetical protein [Vicinamibacterales bacterium]